MTTSAITQRDSTNSSIGPSTIANSSSTCTPVKKHITSACTCCRRRKVKCDGFTPSCSNCKLYDQVCQYTRGEDRRRLSSKKTIQSLSDRVKQLENLLKEYGIEVPPSTTTADESPANKDIGWTIDEDTQKQINSDPSQNHLTTPQVDKETSGFISSPWTPDLDSFRPPSVDSGNLQQTMESSWDQFLYLDQNEVVTSHTHNLGAVRTNNEIMSTAPEQIFVSENTAYYNDLIDYSSTDIDGNEGNVPDSVRDILPSESFVSLLKRPLQQRDSSREDYNPWSKEQDHIQVISINSQRRTQDEDIMDQLSARMGSFQIAEDGQLRYFGATSNLHILHNGIFFLSRSPARAMRTEGNNVLLRDGLAHRVSVDTERHLAELYFKWEDPAIHVVDEEMYYLEQAKWRSGEDGSPFYSETLKNAICAVGASLTSRTDLGVPEPATEFFSLRAKALLDIEMDIPTIATVQALVIMSATEAAFTRDARGWLYSGMAVRLSADLGLHLDLSSQVENGTLTSRELDVRRITFWGVFIHDNMWSLYLGRPSSINFRDISISRPPKQVEQAEAKLWEYVPNAESDIGLGREKQQIYDPIDTCTDSNVSLCEMMKRLGCTLYAGRHLPNQELCNFTTHMREEFSKWSKNLSSDLKIDLSQKDRVYLPHILQLHMQFYAISIFVHRPFFSQNIDFDSKGQQISNQARRDCISAAQSLVSILRLYRKQHTLRRTNVQIVHLVFTASLIHIYNACVSTGVEAQKALDDLQFCCQALTEIGQAYKNSTRALEVLICIKREWQSKTQSKRLKRANSAIDPSKGHKRRTSTISNLGSTMLSDYTSPSTTQQDQHTNGDTNIFTNPSLQDSNPQSEDLSMDALFSTAGFPNLAQYSDNPFTPKDL